MTSAALRVSKIRLGSQQRLSGSEAVALTLTWALRPIYAAATSPHADNRPECVAANGLLGLAAYL